jgi:F-type H+-transporting ATPase subunit b
MEHSEPFYANPSFWVGAAFIVFIGLLAYYKVHLKIVEALDLRAAKIKEEIDAAQRLRDEAQTLLASYERKQRDALKEAAEMLAQARAQAGRDQEAGRRKLDEAIARREQLALDKIALAEAQAEKDVRNAAVEAAVAAARDVIAKNLSGDRAAVLVDESIRDLRRRLH